MIKIKKIFILLIIIVGVTGCSTIDNGEIKYDSIIINSTSIEFDYNELKSAAEVIALIEPVDDITINNSKLYYDDEELLYGFSATRKVKVHKYYKKSTGNDNVVSILEPAAVTENNKIMLLDDYLALEKGRKYIVFLSTDNATNDFSILSGNNGKIDINEIYNNEYFNIAFKSIIDFESDLPDREKEDILKSDIEEGNLNKNSKSIDSDIIEEEIRYSNENGTVVVDF